MLVSASCNWQCKLNSQNNINTELMIKSMNFLEISRGNYSHKICIDLNIYSYIKVEEWKNIPKKLIFCAYPCSMATHSHPFKSLWWLKRTTTILWVYYKVILFQLYFLFSGHSITFIGIPTRKDPKHCWK